MLPLPHTAQSKLTNLPGLILHQSSLTQQYFQHGRGAAGFERQAVGRRHSSSDPDWLRSEKINDPRFVADQLALAVSSLAVYDPVVNSHTS